MSCPGTLHVEVIADCTGKTRTRRLEQSYPQRVTAPLYVDTEPGIAFLCVQSPSGGIFADDALQTTVSATEGGHLLLTSQSATQVFDSAVGAGASHAQRFHVGHDAVVEYVPREIIPHAQARYRQLTRVEVCSGGVFLGWDVLAAGRIARGERHRYRSVCARVEVSVDGRTVARDAVRLDHGTCESRARLVGGDYLATLMIVAPGRDVAPLHHDIAAYFDAQGLVGGVGTLPADAGLLVRIVGASAPGLRRAAAHLVGLHRRHLLRLSPPPPRLL